MTFREFSVTRAVHLTADEEICGELLIEFIKNNRSLERFFSHLGTGTTTTLKLVESYFKYDEHRASNRTKEKRNG